MGAGAIGTLREEEQTVRPHEMRVFRFALAYFGMQLCALGLAFEVMHSKFCFVLPSMSQYKAACARFARDESTPASSAQ